MKTSILLFLALLQVFALAAPVPSAEGLIDRTASPATLEEEGCDEAKAAAIAAGADPDLADVAYPDIYKRE
ncbi:uncharacterized protein LY89DRAFT_790009 [Mollisia scopiformis]|uniref:Uncharacterized protein n=1 Tax=Mollisia scopiformis TaxID=149040 RepID=A0A132B489_MOLSC|nr:uncharacterized protein LY89DRAFT_790009 [Mollisia scopiformis]KUJ07235.1 hypothetical protein LY89DRAFT_790009 [Mollisia scopiformis]